MRILIVAGGTGGHIYPALAVAKELLKRDAEVFWAGSNERMESDIVKKENIPFYGFDIKRSKTAALQNSVAFINVIKFLKKEKPEKIVAAGGYITFYFLLAAYLLKIPFYLMEQNAIPGRVTRVAGRFAKKVFITFENSGKYLKNNNIVVSGNPIRKEIKNVAVTGEKMIVLGGSLGARKLNFAIKELAKEKFFELNDIKVVWITGKRDYEIIKKEIKNCSNIEIFDYRDDIHNVYKEASFAVSRAGATTLSELVALKIPAIFVPYPYAKDNHQHYNAKAIEEIGGAIIVEESDDFREKLKKAILKLNKRENLIKMTECLKDVKNNDAEKIIVEALL